MQTKLLILSIIAISFVILSGCTTNFPNPINDRAQINGSGQPTIRLVQQGSMPASTAYRPYILVNTNVDAKVWEEITAAIAGTVGEAAGAASSDYYKTMRNNYRWRNDLFISGYDNLSDDAMKVILQRGTAPQNDAQK